VGIRNKVEQNFLPGSSTEGGRGDVMDNFQTEKRLSRPQEISPVYHPGKGILFHHKNTQIPQFFSWGSSLSVFSNSGVEREVMWWIASKLKKDYPDPRKILLSTLQVKEFYFTTEIQNTTVFLRKQPHCIQYWWGG
jgi:hypothetical protein